MKRILVTDGMAQSGVEALQANGFEVVEQYFEPEELKEQVKEFDAIVVRSATKVRAPIIDGALETKKLQLIVRGGVGVDNIDVAHAEEKGIAVRNTPAASSASVAELAIAHMFSLARFLYDSNMTMRAGQWEKKKYSKGIELAGKTLGLIGFGRIAKETAKRAYALGMEVLYTNRTGKKAGYDDYTWMPLNDLLAEADFISLHLPFDKNLGAIISEKQFALMKDGVYIVNCARGGVVNEDALLKALDSGKVAAAAIDVFAEEPTKNKTLYTHPKVSLTPHIGASTKEAQDRVADEVVEIITEFFKE
jgi:D-3-phosphoglycerate dehydrogenase